MILLFGFLFGFDFISAAQLFLSWGHVLNGYPCCSHFDTDTVDARRYLLLHLGGRCKLVMGGQLLLTGGEAENSFRPF